MPHLLKAIINFPKWGLSVSDDLTTIIEGELYSDGSHFTIPDYEGELCEITEKACFARFSTLEHEMKMHKIPYDIRFKLPGKASTTQRSWRPGKEGEVEFQLMDEPAILTETLKNLTTQFPDSIPSSIINSLCFEAENSVTPLKEWNSPDVHPTIDDPDNYIKDLAKGVSEFDIGHDLNSIVRNLKISEANNINDQGTNSQVSYLVSLLGVTEAKLLLSDLIEPHLKSRKQPQNGTR